MPDIAKLLKQNDAGFKRYTGIRKATFHEMRAALKQYEAQKTKSGRPSTLSLEEQILLATTYWLSIERCTTSVWTLVFTSLLPAELFVE